MSMPTAVRREDARLVRGAGRYVGDLRVPACVEAVFVRSDVAGGILRAVRLDGTRAVPGVVAAWSAADLGEVPETPPTTDEDAARGRPWPALATGRVRYAGQPVALVVASDRYTGEDGRDAAAVRIDPLPVLLDPTESAGSGHQIFPGLGNVVAEKEFGAPIDDAVWRDAPVVVEARYRQQRVVHTSIEARAILVRPERDGGLTVWVSHQAPHRLRRDLAGAFGLAEPRVRVVVPDVGGAFGGKSETYPEYLAVVAAARRLGRPVRWLEDRAEALTGGPHGRGQNQRVRMAADADGRILAYELHIDADVGGCPHTGSFVPTATATMAGGAYAIARVHVRTRAVVTTTAPTAPYRGAGRAEAASAVERTVDLLARRLRLDPAEVRRRNFIRPDAFPYRTPTGLTYDSGDYPAALAKALDAVGYRQWRAEQRRRRDSGDGRPLGIGLCTYVDRSGAGEEFGAVEAHRDGTVLALSGCCSTGQGHETSFPRVVAAVLGIGADRVRLVEADTAVVPRGTGSFASRSLQTGGAALHRAAGELVDRARRRAAQAWGLPVADVRYGAGRLTAGSRETTLAELAAAGPLRAEETYAPPAAFPFGAYAAVVEVDPDLGDVSVLRLVAVDDHGVVVHPAIVGGQRHGSTVQGLGQALYEELRYSPHGRPENGNLLDYLLPTMSEVPPLTLEETRTPNPNTPLGAKGAGESGCIGAPPAVVNAVADALELSEPDRLQMPLDPRTVWSAARR